MALTRLGPTAPAVAGGEVVACSRRSASGINDELYA